MWMTNGEMAVSIGAIFAKPAGRGSPLTHTLTCFQPIGLKT